MAAVHEVTAHLTDPVSCSIELNVNMQSVKTGCIFLDKCFISQLAIFDFIFS